MSAPLYVGDRLLGCLIDPGAAEYLWRLASTRAGKSKRDGLEVAPHIAEAVDALRATVLAYTEGRTSARGQVPRTSPDMAAGSLPMSTQQLADRLDVGPRHARRLAVVAGVTPIGTNLWPAESADRINRAREDNHRG